MKVIDIALQELVCSFGKQFFLWLDIIRNPKQAILRRNLSSDEEIGNAAIFFIFVVAVVYVVQVPVDHIMWGVNVFDFKTIAPVYITGMLLSLMFPFIIFLVSKILRGKGSFKISMISMIYCIAFQPLLLLPQFISRRDADLIQMFVYDSPIFDVNKLNISIEQILFLLFSSLLEIFVHIFAIIKVVPLVKYIHTIGTFRAVIVLIASGVIHQIISLEIFSPIWLATLEASN